ncbi:hypothetical protein ORJ00_07950 [Rheinheimera baltica]|uniref:hypothetical protein n=1 Tax=Rheinheimera baltica TaxID=67576 RepID=UPI00273ED6F0|nr:hypothetical protein [Rheinheimera baltica]MDP5142667.1 hypothetical protein [Rheinheimera baltica]
MNFVKPILFFSALIFTAACQAQSHNYMGCDWTIPSGFSQKAEHEYSNSVDASNLENWQPASVMFTTYAGPQQEYCRNLAASEDTDVLLLEHSAQPTYNFKYVSSFVRQESVGIPFTVAELSIIKDDKMLVISGLTKADAIALTSGCAEFSQVEQHYEVLQQVKNGYKDFLNSAHGMRVLVP